MSDFDPTFAAEQNLYGPSREIGPSNGGDAVRYGGGGGERGYGGGRGSGYRPRGGRRPGGWNNGYNQGGRGGGGSGGGGQYGPRKDQVDPEEYNIRRMRDMLFRIGDYKEGADDFHPPSELFRLKEQIEEQGSRGSRSLEALFSAFRIMATEQPHKTPLIAALLGFLTLSPRSSSRNDTKRGDGDVNDDMDPSQSPVNYGVMLVKDLVLAFRSDLDARLWRNVRLLLHLFVSLLPLGIIKASSVRTILFSFAAVLEEPGVTAARGDRAVICIIETMCRAGTDLLDSEEDSKAMEQLDELVGRVEKYLGEDRHVEVDLVRPFALRDSSTLADEEFLHEESLVTSVAALVLLKAQNYRKPAFLPSPLDLLPPPVVALARGEIDSDLLVALPETLIPPDDESADAHIGPGVGASSSNPDQIINGRTRHQRRDKKGTGTEVWYRAGAGIERVPCYAKWFKDTVPSSSTPSGVLLRSTLYDIIDLYQVNRKECARILFDSARWLRKGTFVCKSTSPESGIFGETDDQWQIAEDGTTQGAWNLDELIVECVLSTALILPVPPQKPLYYATLLREIVTLNPQSIAPAMGKSVRRIYNVMNSGRAEGEIIRRFAEWFSVHLSNFNFNWNWKEWIPDMSLPASNPKLAFARRIVELEVRLAYFDRIKSTLPEEVKQHVMASEEPSPSFTYATPEHPFRDRALQLIQSLRAKAAAEVILAELESFKKEISPSTASSFLPSTGESDTTGSIKVESEEQADIVVRDILMQAVLSLGSRSFSHLLNVLEKYHPLLRQMTSSPTMRLVILSTTARFWAKSAQWIHICIDKLLQYRLVEPTDVIKFVFSPSDHLPNILIDGNGERLDTTRDWSTFNWWELVKLTINKVNGRVDQVQRRLEALEKAQLDKAERQRAAEEAGDDTMATETKPEVAKPKLPLFPSGATTSTLPRRPDLPPLPGQSMDPAAAAAQTLTEEEKKGKAQSVEEIRTLFTNVTGEQRRVLIDVMQSFVTLLKDQPNDSKAWKRDGQQDNHDDEWQLWWIVAWYREYCRLFNKFLASNHETIVSNVFSGMSQSRTLFTIFDDACQMTSE